MTRSSALNEILHFGRDEERDLLMQGKTEEAYQIECARKKLIYCLNGGTIKAVRELLERMTNFTRDENGVLKCEDVSVFVADDFARNLLVEFKNNF